MVIIVTVIKLLFLERTPLFGDEGLYCYLGYQMQQQGLQRGLQETLFMWKDAPLLPMLNSLSLMIPNVSPVMACRGVVVVTAGIGGFILYLLTQNLWVLIFYLLNPFNVFTDRTNLMEPVFVTTVLFYCWVVLKEKKYLGLVAVVLMFLAKQSAILILPVPFLLRPNRLKVHWWLMGFGVLVGGLFKLTTPLWDTAAMHASLNVDFDRIRQNMWLMGSWMKQYIEVPGLVLIAIGGLVTVMNKRFGLLIPLLLFGVVYAVAGYTLFPRYLLVLLPFMAWLVAEVTRFTWGKIITIGVMMLFLHKDYLILVEPERAPISLEDHYQFFEDWGSGGGTRKAVEYLKNLKFSGNLFVPQDIKGLWVVTQLSYTPTADWRVEFYAPPVEITRPGLLISTIHHQSILNPLRSKLQTKSLFSSNGDARNSVKIEEIIVPIES